MISGVNTYLRMITRGAGHLALSQLSSLLFVTNFHLIQCLTNPLNCAVLRGSLIREARVRYPAVACRGGRL